MLRLFASFGTEPPPVELTQFSVSLGPLRLKWERHGEFSGYVFIVAGLSPEPFSEPATSRLPPGWLQALPGRTIVAAHAKFVAAGDAAPDPQALSEQHFGGNIVVGAGIGEGAGWAFTDFKIHADGCARFVLMDRSLTPRQAGRMLQRLFEIEVYRMLALLALPMARAQLQRIGAIECALAGLTENIAREGADEEALLQELTRTAADIERELTATQFRYGATRAYADLVRTRIDELREIRIAGTQTIDEFMARRFMPAVATCTTVSQRLHEMSERVAQASGAARHACRHRPREAEPGAAGVDGPPRAAAAAAAADGRGPVAGGDRLLRRRSRRLRRQGRQGRRRAAGPRADRRPGDPGRRAGDLVGAQAHAPSPVFRRARPLTRRRRAADPSRYPTSLLKAVSP
ncbi:MAG: DUF3422 domain-containing protein [Comamonadaceae bacterium]|nr:DUF3422 domain-containing protein [Comamonadaceae bacterium]